MKFPKQQQIEAILTGRSDQLVGQHFGRHWFEQVDGRECFDVTAEELEVYVQANGFPGYAISDGRAMQHEKICVCPIPMGWEVYFSERGTKNDVREFATRREAVLHVIEKMLESMRVICNPKVWGRRSTERLTEPRRIIQLGFPGDEHTK